MDSIKILMSVIYLLCACTGLFLTYGKHDFKMPTIAGIGGEKPLRTGVLSSNFKHTDLHIVREDELKSNLNFTKLGYNIVYHNNIRHNAIYNQRADIVVGLYSNYADIDDYKYKDKGYIRDTIIIYGTSDRIDKWCDNKAILTLRKPNVDPEFIYKHMQNIWLNGCRTIKKKEYYPY